MTDTDSGRNRGGVGLFGWLRKRIKPLAGLLLVIIIVAGIFYYYKQFPGRIEELKNYGYLGAFVVSIVLNATIILPVSNLALLMALGAAMPTMPEPVFIGLVGGVGAGIGELTGYLAGRSGRDLIAKNRMYTRVEGWVQRWGMLTIFVLSIVPFLFDLVGLAAGALRLPLWKFFVACWAGRTILYVAMITAAAYGLKTLVPWFG